MHCGDDYERTNCVATVTLADGKATVGPPEIPEVAGPTESEMAGNLLSALYPRRS